MPRFLLVNPYFDPRGRPDYRLATLLSTHDTLEEAYERYDYYVSVAAKYDAIEAIRCVVVDEQRRPVERPRLQVH